MVVFDLVVRYYWVVFIANVYIFLFYIIDIIV